MSNVLKIALNRKIFKFQKQLFLIKNFIRFNSNQKLNGFGFELSDEQKSLLELSDKFTKEEIIPKASHYDKTADFPWDIVKQAHELGLRNLSVPTEYGGAGLSLFDGCLIGNSEKISFFFIVLIFFI